VLSLTAFGSHASVQTSRPPRALPRKQVIDAPLAVVPHWFSWLSASHGQIRS
jgi:hypothetical protein